MRIKKSLNCCTYVCVFTGVPSILFSRSRMVEIVRFRFSYFPSIPHSHFAQLLQSCHVGDILGCFLVVFSRCPLVFSCDVHGNLCSIVNSLVTGTIKMAGKPTASNFGSPDDFEFLTRWCTQLIPLALDGTIHPGWFCSAYGEACLASTSTFDTAGRTAGRNNTFWGWFCYRPLRPPKSMFSIYVSCSVPAGHVYVLSAYVLYVLYVCARVSRVPDRHQEGREERSRAKKKRAEQLFSERIISTR